MFGKEYKVGGEPAAGPTSRNSWCRRKEMAKIKTIGNEKEIFAVEAMKRKKNAVNSLS